MLEMAANACRLAKRYVDDVEFSAEDATRSDWDFLVKIFQVAIEAGATTINVPDTVGYTTPDEFIRLITYLRENTPGIEKAVISVHCHDDLGLAVANSLAAVTAGAMQVECTINGLGEHAPATRRLRRLSWLSGFATTISKRTPASSPNTSIAPVVW